MTLVRYSHYGADDVYSSTTGKRKEHPPENTYASYSHAVSIQNAPMPAYPFEPFKRTLVTGAPDRPYYQDVIASAAGMRLRTQGGPVVYSSSTSVTNNIQIQQSSACPDPAPTDHHLALSAEDADAYLPFFSSSYDFDHLINPSANTRDELMGE